MLAQTSLVHTGVKRLFFLQLLMVKNFMKTVLTMRLEALEKKRSNAVTKLLKKENYMAGNF